MGIPAPSFNYASLATPGGIGQGLGALGGALANAAARRRQAEVEQARLDFEKQGLARLQANDQINRSQGLMRFQEDVNQNRAREEYQMAELGRRQAEDAGQKQRFADEATRRAPMDAAALELTKARTAQANRVSPTATRDRTIVTPQVYLQSTKEAEARADARVVREQGDPKYRTAKAGANGWKMPWQDATAAPTDPMTNRQKYIDEEMGRLGMPLKAPVWGGQGGGASAPDLRARITAAWEGVLSPEVEQALMEAENGDAASAASLERSLVEDPVAPEGETDLFGNP